MTADRRYRRLLFAYPRDVRRERGDEIVGTLLDAGRGRPTFREAANLVAHGLRARLGRPASRTVVVWAALAAVICGLFTAAFATRAAWATARPQPGRAESAAVFAAVLPDRHLGEIDGARAMFTVYSEPLGWDNARTLLFGDGGEYQESGVGVGVLGPGPVDDATVGAIRSRLRALGWHVYPLVVSDAYGCTGPPCDPSAIPSNVTVTAIRGDLIFEIDLLAGSTNETTYMAAGLRRATPAAVWPAGVAGFLAGAVIAWLLFGWASRRTEPGGVAVTVLYGLAMFLWWAPAAAGFGAYTAGGRWSDPQWAPLWEWLGQPTFSLLFLVGTGCALLALSLAALPRRRTSTATAVAG